MRRKRFNVGGVQAVVRSPGLSGGVYHLGQRMVYDLSEVTHDHLGGSDLGDLRCHIVQTVVLTLGNDAALLSGVHSTFS